MIDISREQIDHSLEVTKTKEGLDKYIYLQDNFKIIDVSKNPDFQRKFNHFYRVHRDEQWRKQFYSLLEDRKNSTLSFEETLKILKENTGRFEASFSSKLVATIHPDKPIVDKFVLENAQLKLPPYTEKHRENKIVSVYKKLNDKLSVFIKSPNGMYLVKRFKEKFPDARIKEMKMPDLVLWQTR